MGKTENSVDRIKMLLHNESWLQKQVELRNERAVELNQRTLRIVETIPITKVICEKDDLGEPILATARVQYDISSENLLNQIKEENERLLRQEFKDLYLVIDYTNSMKTTNND
jgi:hypothetical protein